MARFLNALIIGGGQLARKVGINFPVPAFTVQPTISGNPIVGSALVGTPGVATSTLRLTLAWLRNGTAIAGANGAAYLVQPADVGAQIAFQVTATGPGGSTVATSPAVTGAAYVPPVPAFTTAPSISPANGLVGATFTATDGTVNNGTVVSRRWLLGGAAIGTGLSVVPRVAGALVLENTATGPGGLIVTTSAAVRVSVAGSTIKLLGPIGINPDVTQTGSDGNGFPFLDRARTSRGWFSDFGNDPKTGQPWVNPSVNSNGYPTALNADKGSCQTFINASVPYDTDGIVHYVLESSKTDVAFGLFYGATNVVSSITASGLRRIEFDLNANALLETAVGNPLGGYIFGLVITALPTKFRCKADGDTVDDYISIFRADDEATFKAGGIFQQQFVNRMKAFGGMRMMDWCGVNRHLTMADYPTASAWSWADRVPLSVMVALANQTNTDLWVNIAGEATDAQAVAWALYIDQNLNPNLAYYLENANEVWNSGNGAYGYYYNLRNPGGGAENVNYGYRSAQMMAAVLKALNYSARCCPILGTQNYNNSVTERTITGIQQAIAEWNISGNANYNAEYAARFTRAGQIFRVLSPAVYLAAGLDDGGMSSADQATVQSWANDPDGGVAKVLQQLRHGNLVANDSQFLDNWTAVYAGQKAIADREQMRLVAYEGIPVLQQYASTAIHNIFLHAVADPSFQQLTADWCTATLAAGFDGMMLLTEIGYGADDYGLLSNPHQLSTPRWLGATGVQASPPAPTGLAVTLTETGSSVVGANPSIAAIVTGGRGICQVTFTGMLPGQTFDGFRTVSGVLTAEQDTPVALTATVKDATGATASATVNQTVAAKPAGFAVQYARILIQEPHDDTVQATDVWFEAVDGTRYRPSWTANRDTSGNQAAMPEWGDGDDSTYAGTAGVYQLSAGVIEADGVLSATQSVVRMVWRPLFNYRAPRKFQVYVSTQPIVPGTNNGTLVLSVNEADDSNWQNVTPRAFALSG